MTDLYVQTVTLSQYGNTAKPSGHITLAGNGMSTTIVLDAKDAADLQALANRIFTERQAAFAQSVLEAKVTTPLLAGPGAIIDNDEIPF